MAIVARLNKEGSFLLNDDANERLPVVTDGLVVHYPLDGGGGGFDVVGGDGTLQNIEANTNLIEAMSADWRDPSSWSSNSGMEWNEAYQALKITGYHNSWLNTPIVVDTTKEYQVSMEVMEEVQSGIGLYLGGLCNNAAGQKVTTNYDYSYAVNAQPTTGVWTTYRCTRTGTGTITSNTSTTFATVVGWTGTAQVDNLTKYYHYGGLFNYNTGGVMYIRNLRIVAIDADTSNTIETGEEIAIQLATTNVVAGDYDTTFESLPIDDTAGFSNQLGTGGELGVVDFGYKSNKSLRMLRGDGNRAFRTKAILLGDAFTVSAMVYATTAGADIRFEYYGGDYSWSVSYTNNTHTGSGWELLWCSGPAAATSDTTAYYFFYPNQSITPIFVDNIQAELIIYPSAYVNGTSSNSILKINNPVKTGNYTVNFNVKILTTIGTPITYQTIMCMGNYSTNNSWTIMDVGSTTVTGRQRLIREGNGGEWTWLGADLTSTSNFRNFNTITIVRDATNYLAYSNGVYVGSLAHLSTTMQDIITIGSLENVGSRLGASVIKDLSFYDRVLDADEVKQLSENNASIRTDKVIAPLFIETPVLPNDAYYYQLGETTKDITNTLDGTGTTNISYENRAVWVGNETINTFNYPTFENAAAAAGWNHWGAVGHIGTYGQNTDRDFILTPSNTYSHWIADDAAATEPYLLYQSPTFAGGYRSSMAMIKMSDGSEVTVGKIQPIHNANDGGLASGVWSSIEHVGGGWYRCKAEGFSQDGTNDLVGFRISIGYKAYFDYCQLEDKQFASPFVNGTRGTSSLDFNFYDSIGLDWSGDWSISYWKKPQATSNDTLTAYSIESLGSNSNSVGGGYTWWGKPNGADVLNGSTPSGFTSANYFNHWHWISMVKTGSNIVTITRGIEGNLLSVRNTTTTTTTANYYVNQYSYDFKLGGWDDVNVTNTYFRDMVVVKRALSTAEEENLYNQMSIYNDKTIIKNIIEQGI